MSTLLNASSLGGSPDPGVAQTETDSGPLAILALPPIFKKTGLQAKQATSGSSKEDSEDDELEGDMEIIENMDPTDLKRARR